MAIEAYEITMELVGLGTVRADLTRGSAPLTLQAMHKKMQQGFIASRARWMDMDSKEAIYFDIGVKRGKEGAPVELQAGEMGYSHKLDSIVIALVDGASVPYEVVRVGAVTDNLDVFKEMNKFSNSIKIKLVKG